MRTIADDLGRECRLPEGPVTRVVSLVPSLTEALAATRQWAKEAQEQIKREMAEGRAQLEREMAERRMALEEEVARRKADREDSAKKRD